MHNSSFEIFHGGVIVPVIFLVGLFLLARTWLAHRRAQRGLDVLKGYIDQGKEPPAELMEYLRFPGTMPKDNDIARTFFNAILFGGVTAAFAFLAVSNQDNDIYFVVIIMAAATVGMVVKGVIQHYAKNRRDMP